MQKLTRGIALLTLGCVMSGCATRQQPAAPTSKAQTQLTDQTVMAVNWMQQSGEISAQTAFLQSKAQRGSGSTQREYNGRLGNSFLR